MKRETALTGMSPSAEWMHLCGGPASSDVTWPMCARSADRMCSEGCLSQQTAVPSEALRHQPPREVRPSHPSGPFFQLAAWACYLPDGSSHIYLPAPLCPAFLSFAVSSSLQTWKHLPHVCVRLSVYKDLFLFLSPSSLVRNLSFHNPETEGLVRYPRPVRDQQGGIEPGPVAFEGPLICHVHFKVKAGFQR